MTKKWIIERRTDGSDSYHVQGDRIEITDDQQVRVYVSDNGGESLVFAAKSYWTVRLVDHDVVMQIP